MAKLVSKTYGEALFELAKQENRIDELYPQVEQLVHVFQENIELTKVLEQPKIAKAQKVQLIEEIFSDSIAKEMIGLMVLLIQKNHYTDMEAVFTYFIGRVKEEKKIGIACVTSAMDLKEIQKEMIEKRLLETTTYESFEMNYVVDRSLIGGLVIRIGDRVMDNSIKTKLYGLSKELKNIQLV